MAERPASRRLLGVVLGVALLALPGRAADLEPIVYTITVTDPASHLAQVDAVLPVEGRRTLDLMMAVWSPGFYRVEDYATRVQAITARDAGHDLPVEPVGKNRWRVSLPIGASSHLTVSYTLRCNESSVTTNWVGPDYGVFTGPATFVTLVEPVKRPHDVRFSLPPEWFTTASGLPAAPGGGRNRYRASDFEMLADSPILAGKLGVESFTVDGKVHNVVSAGDVGTWSATRAAADLRKIVTEARRFWGFELPVQAVRVPAAVSSGRWRPRAQGFRVGHLEPRDGRIARGLSTVAEPDEPRVFPRVQRQAAAPRGTRAL